MKYYLIINQKYISIAKLEYILEPSAEKAIFEIASYMRLGNAIWLCLSAIVDNKLKDKNFQTQAQIALEQDYVDSRLETPHMLTLIDSVQYNIKLTFGATDYQSCGYHSSLKIYTVKTW
jgi:hypothetical protein